MENKRCHRRAVSTRSGRIVAFEIIRVIDDETSLKSPVRLQRKPVEQRYDRNTHRFRLGQRVGVAFSMIVRKRRRHLSAGAQELNVLALDEMHLVVQRLEQRLNLSDWNARQQCEVGYFLDLCVANHSTIQFFDESGNPIPGHTTICRISPVPELDFARHDFLAVFDALSPVVENSRLEKSVLDSPWPDIPKLPKEILPLPKTMRQTSVGLPVVPEREHLLQSNLIREDQEQATPKSLVRASLTAFVQSKKIVVRWYSLLFDFCEPLHSWYPLHSADEVLDRPHGFQYDDILGNEIVGICLESRPSRLHRLLQKREPRRESFCLPFETWPAEISVTTASSFSCYRLPRIRENQQRAFRHRHLPNASARNSRPERGTAIASAVPRRLRGHRRGAG